MKAANKSIEILSLASTSGTLMVVVEDSQQEHDTQRTTLGDLRKKRDSSVIEY